MLSVFDVAPLFLLPLLSGFALLVHFVVTFLYYCSVLTAFISILFLGLLLDLSDTLCFYFAVVVYCHVSICLLMLLFYPYVLLTILFLLLLRCLIHFVFPSRLVVGNVTGAEVFFFLFVCFCCINVFMMLLSPFVAAYCCYFG